MAQGERVISDEVQESLDATEENEKLSSREMAVLQALARGENSKQIADAFGISPKTIDSHRTNMLRKMDVNSTAALLVKAIRSGLINV